jgi:hypothetical protein
MLASNLARCRLNRGRLQVRSASPRAKFRRSGNNHRLIDNSALRPPPIPTNAKRHTSDIYGTVLFYSIKSDTITTNALDRPNEGITNDNNPSRADLAYLHDYTAISAQDLERICLSAIRGSKEESLTSAEDILHQGSVADAGLRIGKRHGKH